MRFFILTDLEGVAGIDSFRYTRTNCEERKVPAMTQLARETNACIDGIRAVYPNADVDVWDGHGSGGLHESDIVDACYRDDDRAYYNLDGYDAMMFVGQHAMAGTAFAPLAHTYNSVEIAYYRLNGFFIGEFGARALVAGRQGVPTIYLAGDDKAAHEAENFIPGIETTVTKRGTGLEAAEHLDSDEACNQIRSDTLRAVEQFRKIPPFDRIEPAYQLEIRFYDPVSDETLSERDDYDILSRVDDFTIQLEAEELAELPF